ncbi:transporter [Novipirellula artificiosorum]|uniref:transporter n=1 Tax=Novipirellula artificiosorum TaxID=2528016 RepID=UPI0018CE7CE8|nr:transporter [Novipirellula artificiosorum]
MGTHLSRLPLSFAFTTVLLIAGQAVAQEEREIETDRDSFTPALSTVEQGRVMVEAAYTFVDNSGVAESHSFPELLLRYGLTENIELRFGSNYEIGGEPNATSGSGGFDIGEAFETEPGALEEEAKVTYGFKVLLLEQHGWVPLSNFTLMGATPTSGKETASRMIASYTFGWDFNNEWEWASAIRYGFIGASEDSFNSWAPSTVIRVPVSERVKLHAEYFGIFTDGAESETTKHFFSPGVHYLITKDLEVGVRAGWGLNDQSADFFSNVGFGWQF